MSLVLSFNFVTKLPQPGDSKVTFRTSWRLSNHSKVKSSLSRAGLSVINCLSTSEVACSVCGAQQTNYMLFFLYEHNVYKHTEPDFWW